MAKIKKVNIWQLRKGMIIIRADKHDVAFDGCFKPLPNHEGVTEYFDKLGVQDLYIWHDDNPNDTEINYKVVSEDDIDSLNIAIASEIISSSKKVIQQSLDNIKKGSYVEAQAITNTVKELLGILKTNPIMFANIITPKEEGVKEAGHAIRVCVITLMIGLIMRMKYQDLLDLGTASLIHDVGFAKIPAHIMNKKDPLSEKDIEIMQKHPEFAQAMISKNKQLSPEVSTIILQHHEYCDTSGYPSRLSDKYMSLSSKILSVAEAYKSKTDGSFENIEPKIPSDAVKEIFASAGKKFNLDIVKAFILIVGVFPVGSLVKLSNGHFGVVCETNMKEQSKPKVLSLGPDCKSEYELLNLSKLPNIKIIEAVNPTAMDIDTSQIFRHFVYSRLKTKLQDS